MKFSFGGKGLSCDLSGAVFCSGRKLGPNHAAVGERAVLLWAMIPRGSCSCSGSAACCCGDACCCGTAAACGCGAGCCCGACRRTSRSSFAGQRSMVLGRVPMPIQCLVFRRYFFKVTPERFYRFPLQDSRFFRE